MNQHYNHRYEDGPTVCIGNPKVVKNVRSQIKKSGALSPADVRLARRMGLVDISRLGRTGFNDGVVYPPGDVPQPTAAPRARRGIHLALAAPSTGSRKLHALALMVDFSDNQGTRQPAEFRTMLFDPANPDSMTSIYKELSGGLLEVTGEVIGYVRAPQPYGYYTAGESGTGDNYPNNTPGLLFDALTEFCKNDNLKRFDTDGDGFVDGIFLIHAGGGAEAEPDPAKRKEMIWSHKWVLPQTFVNKGVKVFAYSTEPEDGRVGVFSHEFGHVLGLPDLYDISYRAEGVGKWCLMAAGSWGGNGKKPVRLSAWCLSKLGWITPKRMASPTGKVLKLEPIAKNPDHCYRVSIGAATGPEYFLLEHRPDIERDGELPAGGLLIWHVDETRSDNTNTAAPLVGLIQADGRGDLEAARNQGDPGDVFPGSTSKTKIDDNTTPHTRANDGNTSGIAFSNISRSSAPMLVSVKVKT